MSKSIIKPLTISQYIIEKLVEHNCKHVIGIPATNCAGFFNAMDASKGKIEYIIPTSELEAGYIADGYARNGELSALCVAYGVGTLSLTNPLAGAYAEKLPMILINGGPTSDEVAIEEKYGSLFLHSTGVKSNDYNIFKHITAYATIIQSSVEAKSKIDEAFKIAVEKSQPVYLEIPSDYWNLPIDPNPEAGDIDYFVAELKSVVKNKVEEAIFNKPFVERAKEVIKIVNNPFKDVLLIVGPEVIRKGLSNDVLEFVLKHKVPFVTTPLSKSFETVFEGYFEKLPGKNGKTNRRFHNEMGLLYKGCLDTISFLTDDLNDVITNAQYFISLGNVWGVDNKKFIVDNYSKMIEVGYNDGRIGYKKFHNIGSLKSVVNSINDAINTINFKEILDLFISQSAKHQPQPNTISHDQLHQTIEEFIISKKCPNILFNVDACLAMFWGTEIKLNKGSEYISNPSWLSIGHSAPASIGHYLKNKKAPLIVTGDGGFQMVSQTYSTMLKLGIPALIIVVNNSILGIEEYLLDQKSKNVDPFKYTYVRPWNYEAFPEVYKGKREFGIKCTSQESLKKQLSEWADYLNGTEANHPWIINCVVDTMSIPTRIDNSNTQVSNSFLPTFKLR